MLGTVRSRWLVIGLLATVVGVMQPVRLASQENDSGRKVKNRVQPIYPDLAKRMNLSGVVKIQVNVTAAGVAKSTKPLGGNPVLIEAAIDAVRKWRWEAGSESVEVVEFHFTAQ